MMKRMPHLLQGVFIASSILLICHIYFRIYLPDYALVDTYTSPVDWVVFIALFGAQAGTAGVLLNIKWAFDSRIVDRKLLIKYRMGKGLFRIGVAEIYISNITICSFRGIPYIRTSQSGLAEKKLVVFGVPLDLIGEISAPQSAARS